MKLIFQKVSPKIRDNPLGVIHSFFYSSDFFKQKIPPKSPEVCLVSEQKFLFYIYLDFSYCWFDMNFQIAFNVVFNVAFNVDI